MNYEMFQQGPIVYIPIILLSLIITVIAYGAFPYVFAKARRKHITQKKYRYLCYGINLAVMFLFIVINGEASSGGPYLLWTWIFSSWGIRILNAKGLFADGSYMQKTNTQVLEKAILPPDADQIRFCRKCGNMLIDNAIFCNKCGTKIVKEQKHEMHEM